MKPLRVLFPLTFTLAICFSLWAQGPTPKPPSKSAGFSALCKLESLPPEIRHSIKKDFGDWEIQAPAYLSARASERWQSEKPLKCPGIAVGQFDESKKPSYALLLVQVKRAGYRFVVFSAMVDRASYDAKVVEQSDASGATNLFIRSIQNGKFFNEQSKRKFHVQTGEGILFVDSGERVYQTDVYFWADGRYQHEPVDY